MNIFEKAIQKFGAEHQKMMAIEEMSELMQAISKHNRNPSEKTRMNLLEEIADVSIMCAQLMCIYGITDKDLDKMLDIKLEKLEKLLKSGIGNDSAP